MIHFGEKPYENHSSARRGATIWRKLYFFAVVASHSSGETPVSVEGSQLRCARLVSSTLMNAVNVNLLLIEIAGDLSSARFSDTNKCPIDLFSKTLDCKSASRAGMFIGQQVGNECRNSAWLRVVPAVNVLLDC